MIARETFTACRRAVLEERQIATQLEQCLPTGAPAGLHAQRYDSRPPGTNDPTAAALQLHEGLMAQQLEARSRIAALTRAAMGYLRQLKDPRDRVILAGYYLLGQTDQEIAARQKLSREHVCRLRRQALAAIND